MSYCQQTRRLHRWQPASKHYTHKHIHCRHQELEICIKKSPTGHHPSARSVQHQFTAEAVADEASCTRQVSLIWSHQCRKASKQADLANLSDKLSKLQSERIHTIYTISFMLCIFANFLHWDLAILSQDFRLLALLSWNTERWTQ